VATRGPAAPANAARTNDRGLEWLGFTPDDAFGRMLSVFID
jgi:hypothetical protein